MENPNPNQKQQIKLHIPKDLSALYSNIAVMSATKNEFIIDFAQMLPPAPRANVQSRIVMTPQHAKLLYTLLQRNIERYEAQHGPIEVNIPQSLADQLFRNVRPENDNDDDE